MNVVVEEIVSEFPVEVTEVVVVVEVSDAVSFLELTDVADNSYEGKDGYVPTVNEATGKLELKPQTGGGGVSDGDKGDIVVSGSGTIWSIKSTLKDAWNGAVTWISTNGANVISAYEWVSTYGASVLSHIASTSNPHNVTKSQVGLGNVQNVDTTTTSNVTEGSRLYFTTARVLATVLSGLSVASGGSIVDTDTVLVAFGKLQNQINSLQSALAGKENTITEGTTSQYYRGDKTFQTLNVSAVSGLQNELDVRVRILLNDNVDSSVITGTILNSALKSYLIPANTLAVGDTIDFKAVCSKTNGGAPANCNFRLYTNTSNNLGTALPLALVVPAANNLYFSLDRTYTLKSGNTLESFPVNSSAATDEVATITAISNTSFNPSVDNWFIVAIQPNNAGDSFKQTLCYITLMKSKTTI